MFSIVDPSRPSPLNIILLIRVTFFLSYDDSSVWLCCFVVQFLSFVVVSFVMLCSLYV